ncbi:hypothetical protein [Pedobacter hartonius]|uniref:Uncharacterized protein n=1 Tax=Pedobacter hartonius TaxID=425514 RepID=A0A1H4AJR4_9SPHI|nr:hypothetical protein [Pedobacter hartonius]SEA36047.1 hypothetical protein SAMN05443550_1036 [Pedobacter hartonius]
MEKQEFSEAVNAYLSRTADSWQEFIVEDYYDSYTHCFDVLELFQEAQIKEIGDRIFAKIIKKIRRMER